MWLHELAGMLSLSLRRFHITSSALSATSIQVVVRPFEAYLCKRPCLVRVLPQVFVTKQTQRIVTPKKFVLISDQNITPSTANLVVVPYPEQDCGSPRSGEVKRSSFQHFRSIRGKICWPSDQRRVMSLHDICRLVLSPVKWVEVIAIGDSPEAARQWFDSAADSSRCFKCWTVTHWASPSNVQCAVTYKITQSTASFFD